MRVTIPARAAAIHDDRLTSPGAPFRTGAAARSVTRLMADELIATRLTLHAVAEQVLRALRLELTGNEIALRVVGGGFATPPLPGGGWAGVEGTDVVRVEPDGTIRRTPLTSLRAAGTHVGLATAAELDDAPLDVVPEAARRLTAALAIGDRALALLLAEAGPADDPSSVHLWPEHFDVAVELGAGDARANYGVSPGDDQHPEPYAYVGPWTPPPTGPLWQATGFAGAEAGVDDPDGVVGFWRARRAALVTG